MNSKNNHIKWVQDQTIHELKEITTKSINYLAFENSIIENESIQNNYEIIANLIINKLLNINMLNIHKQIQNEKQNQIFLKNLNFCINFSSCMIWIKEDLKKSDLFQQFYQNNQKLFEQSTNIIKNASEQYLFVKNQNIQDFIERMVGYLQIIKEIPINLISLECFQSLWEDIDSLVCQNLITLFEEHVNTSINKQGILITNAYQFIYTLEKEEKLMSNTLIVLQNIMNSQINKYQPEIIKDANHNVYKNKKLLNIEQDLNKLNQQVDSMYDRFNQPNQQVEQFFEQIYSAFQKKQKQKKEELKQQLHQQQQQQLQQQQDSQRRQQRSYQRKQLQYIEIKKSFSFLAQIMILGSFIYFAFQQINNQENTFDMNNLPYYDQQQMVTLYNHTNQKKLFEENIINFLQERRVSMLNFLDKQQYLNAKQEQNHLILYQNNFNKIKNLTNITNTVKYMKNQLRQQYKKKEDQLSQQFGVNFTQLFEFYSFVKSFGYEYQGNKNIFEYLNNVINQTQIVKDFENFKGDNLHQSLNLITQLQEKKQIFEGDILSYFEMLFQIVNDKQFYQKFNLEREEASKLLNQGIWRVHDFIGVQLKKQAKFLQKEIVKLINNNQYNNATLIFKQFSSFLLQFQDRYQLQEFLEETRSVIFNYYITTYKNVDYQISLQVYNSFLNSQLEELEQFQKHFKSDFYEEIQEFNYNLLKTKLSENIKKQYSEELYQAIQNEQQLNIFMQKLIEFRKIGSEISSIHKEIIQMISEIIDKQVTSFNQILLSKFQSTLYQSSIGKRIIIENKSTFSEQLSKFYIEASKKQNNLDYILNNISGTDINVPDFKNIYLEFNQTMWGTINQYKTVGIVKLQDQIQKKSKKLKESLNVSNIQITLSKKNKQKLVELIAIVSSYWSLLHCQDHNSSYKVIHPVQVFAILRLMNLDSTKENQFQSHFAQVNTGEGKSIILGIVSSVVALLGFEVRVCNYSGYLSERDFQDFKELFESLNLLNQIKYSTIDFLYEDILNKDDILRNQTKEKIFNSNSYQNILSHQEHHKKQILILDEVDYFFCENFLGQSYSIGEKFFSPDVESLIKYIWNNRDDLPTFEDIQQTQQYQSLFQKNPSLKRIKEIIDYQIKLMRHDVLFLKKKRHSYVPYFDKELNQLKISYTKNDGVQLNIVKGYKTAFAYLEQYDRFTKNSTFQLNWNQTLSQNLFLQISIGSFSYSEIPKKYQLIFGVSGTLQSRTKFEKDIIDPIFNIQKQTIVPSLFDTSKFQFDSFKETKIFQSNEQQFIEILSKINNIINERRSIIIFFRDSQNIYDFRDYLKKTQNNHLKINILESGTINKQFKIEQAVKQGVVTLSTHEFIRGCDFFVTDESLLNQGGIHVILAYLPFMQSDIKQVQGRTARYSQNGSFSIVLSKESEKEQFSMVEEEIWKRVTIENQQNNKTYSSYQFIIDSIDKYQNQKYPFMEQNKEKIQQNIRYQ